MRRPWWFLQPTDDAEETIGEYAPGKVLVVTMRDAEGYPVQRAWVDEAEAWQWDDTRWNRKPFPHISE